MAFDAGRGYVVLFGGRSPLSQPLADTWEWDGVRWRQRSPATNPPATSLRRDFYYGPMVYDARRQRCVLYGGIYVTKPRNGGMPISASIGALWEWDGVTWVEGSGPEKKGHGMVYDEARGRVVAVGGFAYPWRFETLEWEGEDWLDRVTPVSPVYRTDPAVAYDSTRRRTVLFGGWGNQPLADTWEYGPDTPATYSSFGAACGTFPVPVLRPGDLHLPWTGQVFEAHIDNLPGDASWMVMGLSDHKYGTLDLPISLGFLGMPGCTAYVSLDYSAPLPSTGGTAIWTVDIPTSASLVGAVFFIQGVVYDPAANPMGLTVTNAGRLQIGSK